MPDYARVFKSGGSAARFSAATKWVSRRILLVEYLRARLLSRRTVPRDRHNRAIAGTRAPVLLNLETRIDPGDSAMIRRPERSALHPIAALAAATLARLGGEMHWRPLGGRSRSWRLGNPACG